MTVNGTGDVALGRDAVDWRLHEDNVRRLRRRIFKAVKEGGLAKVTSLQKIMLRSWSSALVSVRQVAQRNTGRATAGIDGEVALIAPARMALAVRGHHSIGTWRPVLVKWVYLPKASNRAKLRPLGIPVLLDWQLTCKWACRSHPRKPKHWIVRRYFGRFNPSRRDNWVFGDAASGAHLPRLAWTPIIRHRNVTGRAFPRRPGPDRLLGLAARHQPAPARPQHPAPAQKAARALRALRGPALARRPAPYSERMATVAPHHPQAITRQFIARGPGAPDATRLIHAYCQRRAAGAGSQEPASSRT